MALFFLDFLGEDDLLLKSASIAASLDSLRGGGAVPPRAAALSGSGSGGEGKQGKKAKSAAVQPGARSASISSGPPIPNPGLYLDV